MAVPEPTIVLDAVESSQPGEVRRTVKNLASRLGFDETQQGKAAIVATELANNLVRHALRGSMLVQATSGPSGGILEMVAIDHGPGISNVEQSLADGYSTGGTPGGGLGAVRRLASAFDIHTTPGTGTAVLARLLSSPRERPTIGGFQVGGIRSCYPGESECGDAWDTAELGQTLKIMVADGLGHGALAAEAAAVAVRIFHEHAGRSTPAEIMDMANGALRSTRGAAMAIAEIDADRQQLQYAGIGNIGAIIIEPTGVKSLVSVNGTVGATARKPQTFSYNWSPRATLVMFSDGLLSQLRPDKHPGLLMRDPTTIAAVLYRDFKRGRDDATVVVARQKQQELAP
jgi:anti-sigma regulatory factor (Ser/Thr protein kinase)/serine/threonine protein phosphatase PrpC